MRQCRVFVVSEIRKPANADAIVIGSPFFRPGDPLLNGNALGFPTELLGEGELVLSNTLEVIDLDCIAGEPDTVSTCSPL